jgi:hypothetical protein
LSIRTTGLCSSSSRSADGTRRNTHGRTAGRIILSRRGPQWSGA